jgi:thiol-disulfide isomerase/thioredoxin
MRKLRYSVTAFVIIAIGTLPAGAQQAPKAPTAKDLLGLSPILAGVEYDVPPDEAAKNACKVENVLNDQQRSIGYALRDGQGKLLRRFVIAHGSKRLDQWSYYQDGFEVYREDDLDGDRSLDQCRWLNAGGSRIAVVQQGKVRGWRQISAEEASKVLVHAIVRGDLPLLESVMATAEELTGAGVPKDIVDKVAAEAGRRNEAVSALRKQLVGWNEQTVWNRFDGTLPHVIPADTSAGLEKDLTLYENAMVIPSSTAGQAANAKLAFLQVPDTIQLGASWKFIELPRAIDPEKPIVAAVSGLRSMLFDKANQAAPHEDGVDTALKELADYDVKNAPLLQGGQPENVARYHVGRIPVLRAIPKLMKNPDDQLLYNKQVVDSLIAALRTGAYPEGKKVIDAIIGAGGKLASYAASNLIDAEFAMKNDQPGANFLQNQKKWMADLEDYLTRYQTADEVPTVLFKLAQANEFDGEDARARTQYTKLVDHYAATDAGKKAAGALKRLDLVGKPLSIKGPGLQNQSVDTSLYGGKPVLVVFWASWAKAAKDDLPHLIKVYEKYHGRGLEVVGVNLDNSRDDLNAFLTNNPIAWPQIYEPGAIDGRLAVEYGIISLPTMFLIDDKGKVVNCSLRDSREIEPVIEKLLPAKQAGVALDRKD